MTPEQCRNLHQWFDTYVRQFYGDDPYTNANIRMKENHTGRVVENILALAGSLDLDAGERLLADTAALLHDIGRFEQFRRWRTYADIHSENHARLGVAVLTELGTLDPLSSADRTIVLKSIEYHNLPSVPDGSDPLLVRIAKLVRDADKLDIWHVALSYFEQNDRDTNAALQLELPDNDEYSTEICGDILAGRITRFREMKSLNDLKLLEISWVKDLNYAWSLEQVRKKRMRSGLCWRTCGSI